MKKTIDSLEVDNKGKIHLKLHTNGQTFEIIKLYENANYIDALTEAELELEDLINEGLPEGVNQKVKYLLNDKPRKETKEVRQEN